MGGNEIIKTIQKIVLDVIKASKPCDIRYATIDKLEPLSITLQNVQLTITEPNVSSLESTNELTIDDVIHKHTYTDDAGEGESSTKETENALNNIQTYLNKVGQGKTEDGKIIIRKGLQVGDKVAVIRANGGQDYLIIGRVNV